MTDTITEAQLIERLKEAGLYTEKRTLEVVKLADELQVGDTFLVAAPNSDDTVLFTVTGVAAAPRYNLKPGTRGIYGTYGMGGEDHKASFVANDLAQFTVLVIPE